LPLRRRLGRPRPDVHRLGRRAVAAEDPQGRAAAVPVLVVVPGPALRRDGGGRQAVGRSGRIKSRMDRNLARKNVRTGLIAGAVCFVMFGLTFLAAAIYVA